MATVTLPQPGTGTPLPNSNILDNSICILLSFGRFGDEKSIAKKKIAQKDGSDPNAAEEAGATVEVKANPGWVGVTKKLIKSKALDAIQTHDDAVKGWVRDRCLPSPLKGKGVYLIKADADAIALVDEYLEKAAADRLKLVDKFIQDFEMAKMEAQAMLGPDDFDEADYPSEQGLRARFVFEWQFLSFAVPGKLKHISAAVFEKERAKASEKWAEATEECRLLLRSGLKTLVDHMVERLTPDAEGKTKRFTKSTIDNVMGFLTTFDLRNITDDSELGQIVDSAKTILKGVDAKTLKTNEAVRDYVMKGFGLVGQALDVMVVEAGTRKITFEADEAAEESEAIEA